MHPTYFFAPQRLHAKISTSHADSRVRIWRFLNVFFISPLFNQVGQLRTSSHLQLRPGQDKAKQCDNKQQKRVTHGINKSTVYNTIAQKIYMQCVLME
jgi:hypothetical protein